MLHEVFYWLFNMSMIAAAAGALIMLIRLIKRIPKRVIVLLWLIPFLRMTIPFGMNSPYSLLSLLSGFTVKTITVYQPTESIAFSISNLFRAAESYFPITYKLNIFENIFRIASVIWVIVAAIILIMFAVAYLLTLAEIKDAIHLKDNIYLSEKVITPAVYGIIRPKIVLPLSY